MIWGPQWTKLRIDWYQLKIPNQFREGFLDCCRNVLQKVDSCSWFLLTQAVGLGKRWHRFVCLHKVHRSGCGFKPRIFMMTDSISQLTYVSLAALSDLTVKSCEMPDRAKNWSWCSKLKAFGLRRKVLLNATPDEAGKRNQVSTMVKQTWCNDLYIEIRIVLISKCCWATTVCVDHVIAVRLNRCGIHNTERPWCSAVQPPKLQNLLWWSMGAGVERQIYPRGSLTAVGNSFQGPCGKGHK